MIADLATEMSIIKVDISDLASDIAIMKREADRFSTVDTNADTQVCQRAMAIMMKDLAQEVLNLRNDLNDMISDDSEITQAAKGSGMVEDCKNPYQLFRKALKNDPKMLRAYKDNVATAFIEAFPRNTTGLSYEFISGIANEAAHRFFDNLLKGV